MRKSAIFPETPLLLYLLIVPVLFVICNPFVEMGAIDDWEYTFLARSLAQTGHIHMDGWSRAFAVPQALWGALAIKIAGFSFMAIRASMIPIVLGCCALIYAIARWLGLSPWLASLAVAEMLLCPLFLPLATTFMTDVPSLLFMLITLYCVLRGVEAPPRSAGKWIVLAAVVGFVGGVNRQVVWAAPVVMIGAFIFLRRREQRLVWVAVGAVAGVTLSAGFAQAWFAKMGIMAGIPATLPTAVEIMQRTASASFRALLCMSLYCLPALLLLLGSRIVWTRRAPVACGVGAGLLIVIVAMSPDLMRAPWLGDTVTVFGIMRPGEALAGVRPVALHRVITHGLGVAVIAFTLVALVALPAIGRALRESGSLDSRLRIFGVVAASFCAVYFPGSLISTMGSSPFFDRYLIPMIPVLNLGAMAVAARLPATALRLAAVPILLMFGLWGMAITHDWFRLDEARARAGDRLVQIGVPRTCISGGYEYDGWTQLAETGRIGRAAHDVLQVLASPPPGNTAKEFWFLRLTSSVHPQYFMVTSPQPGFARTVFTESYRTWLPPNHRQILVQADSPPRCD